LDLVWRRTRAWEAKENHTVNGGKVCRKALTRVSFGIGGDSDAKAEDD